jgi:hypothetical protein
MPVCRLLRIPCCSHSIGMVYFVGCGDNCKKWDLFDRKMNLTKLQWGGAMAIRSVF